MLSKRSGTRIRGRGLGEVCKRGFWTLGRGNIDENPTQSELWSSREEWIQENNTPFTYISLGFPGTTFPVIVDYGGDDNEV